MVLRGLRDIKKRWNQAALSGMKRLLMVTEQAKFVGEDTRTIRAGLLKQADCANLLAYFKSYLE